MKKVLVIVCTMILAIVLAGCNRQVSSSVITDSTKDVWNNSAETETSEQFIFKNLNIGGVMNINNLIIDVEKKVSKDKILVNVATKNNMSVQIDEKAKGIIDMILDYKKLKGNLKVKHLEQAWSKVGIKSNLEFTGNSVKGVLEILNIKDMFKDNMSKPLKIDINLKNLNKDDSYKKLYNHLKSHPISTFFPTTKDSFNLSKETAVTFDSCKLCEIADGYICKNCDKQINKSNMTLKRVLFDTFAETTADGILKDCLKIENPTAKFKLSSKNGKEFVDSMNVKSKIKLNISKSQLNIIAKDLSVIYNDEKIYEVFKGIESILRYDKSLVSGDMEIIIRTDIIK